MKVSVSVLSANDRIICIKKLNKTNLDYFHIDTMDGIFVDNYQMPIQEIKEMAKYVKKPLDVHLMVENPEEYLEHLEGLPVKCVTFHLEISRDIKRLAKIVKQKGYLVGLSIKPKTDIKKLQPYLKWIDLILVMSVEPGQGGQTFITSTIDRIKEIKKLIENTNILIEVDGGINDTNIQTLKEIGVDIVVSGSYIVKSDNYQNQIDKLKI